MAEYHVESFFSPRFEVIAGDGTSVGSLEFPGPIDILDITRTHVLGVERNELDVQAVTLYVIDRAR